MPTLKVTLVFATCISLFVLVNTKVFAGCTGPMEIEPNCYNSPNVSGCERSGDQVWYSERMSGYDPWCQENGAGGYVYGYRSRQYECTAGSMPDECGGAGCFLPGTKIQTKTGERNIEDLKVGDKVLSFDPETKEISENTVASSIVTTKPKYYEITTASGRKVFATAEHPFFVGMKEENLGLLREFGVLKNNIKYKVSNLLNSVFGMTL